MARAACRGGGSVAGGWSRENSSRVLLFVALNVTCHDFDISFSPTYAVLGVGAGFRKRNGEADSTCARTGVIIKVAELAALLHCLLHLVRHLNSKKMKTNTFLWTLFIRTTHAN